MIKGRGCPETDCTETYAHCYTPKTGNCQRKYHVRHHNDMPAHVGQDGAELVRRTVRSVLDDLTYYGCLVRYVSGFSPRESVFAQPPAKRARVVFHLETFPDHLEQQIQLPRARLEFETARLLLHPTPGCPGYLLGDLALVGPVPCRACSRYCHPACAAASLAWRSRAGPPTRGRIVM